MKEYRSQLRAECYARLGSVCVCCGSAEDLEFDHIDPTTKDFTIGTVWTCKRSILLAEVDKCQLLCVKCHLKKSADEGSFRRSKPSINGTKPWQWKYSLGDTERLLSLYESGMSFREIAKREGVSHSTISTAIKRLEQSRVY